MKKTKNVLNKKNSKPQAENKRYHKQQLIAATESMYEYPYKNLSLVDMDGEIWIPFPDFPESYAISNKGRIKSLERMCISAKGCWMQSSRIMKQRIIAKTNPYSGKINYTVCAVTCVHSVQKYHMVSRLVYEAFIGPIPDHANAIIRHKDDDARNNTPENVYLSNFNELHTDMIEVGRRKRLFGCSDPNLWTVEEKRSLYDCLRKPVSQFDLHGNFIRTFEGMNDAARSVGIDDYSLIGKSTKGEIHTTGGYQWRAGSDPSPMKPAKSIRTWQRVKRTAKYDLQGKLLTIYPSVAIAAQESAMEVTRLYGILKYPNRIPKEGETCYWRNFWPDEEIPPKIEPPVCNKKEMKSKD